MWQAWFVLVLLGSVLQGTVWQAGRGPFVQGRVGWVRLGLAGMACLAVAVFGGDWYGRRGSVCSVKARYVLVRFGQAGVFGFGRVLCGWAGMVCSV